MVEKMVRGNKTILPLAPTLLRRQHGIRTAKNIPVKSLTSQNSATSNFFTGRRFIRGLSYPS